ncbi:Probable Co/Zn/Cd efflux system membrane fusion protein [hydrothermal vent metagenome]|uniref:Probable Co/Zn/Cd efflux system membrane fusion protein n=1 Tax=hydrothermal vent metagenome TaxID=652676 RepID=A0A3B1AT45_9ZZZZ
MRKHRRLILISLLASGLLLALLSYFNQPKAISVVIHTVSRGEVLSSVANTRAGTLKACRRARLSPSIGGQIKRLPVNEGDRVKQDDLLLEIWNDDLNAQLSLARGETKTANSRAREACVIAKGALREARRLRKLAHKNLASEEAIDRAENDANARQAACNAANTSIEVSQARIDVAAAALARTRLLAPFDGSVAEVNGELGEYLTPSPVGVATLPAIDLIDDTCLYVSAPIDEVDAPQIKTGMDANISLDAFAGTLFKGKIRRVASYVLEREKQARTVEVEVEFRNPTDAKKMLPGYSADVEVILERRENVLHIATEALMEDHYVYLLLDDGIINKRQIKTGIHNWSYTEVVSGLEQGDRIVVSAEREGLEDGVRVKAE